MNSDISSETAQTVMKGHLVHQYRVCYAHSDTECNAQRRKRNTVSQPQDKVQSAYTATESTARDEEDDVGNVFFASGWTLSAAFQGTARPTGRRKSSADTSRLPRRTLTLLLNRGASSHYFDDKLDPSLNEKLLNNKPLEKSHKILTVGRHVLSETTMCTIQGKNHPHGRQQASSKTCRLGRTRGTQSFMKTATAAAQSRQQQFSVGTAWKANIHTRCTDTRRRQ